MAIKARSDQPNAARPEQERLPGGNRCPVRHCVGTLRGETDDIGRVRYTCDDCERRAKMEHESRFGTYLDRLRAERREREARIFEAAEEQVERRCDYCGDPIAPPHTNTCSKPECKRRWKADYQRRRFGRPLKPDVPDAGELDLFKDFP